MRRIIPKGLVSIAIFIPNDNEEVDMPLDKEKYTEDGFFEIDVLSFLGYEKDLSLTYSEHNEGYFMEVRHKMMIEVPVNENAKRLDECRMSGSVIGLSFILAQIEGNVRVTNTEISIAGSPRMRFTFEW